MFTMEAAVIEVGLGGMQVQADSLSVAIYAHLQHVSSFKI